MSSHIYPIFDTIVQQEDKEKLLNQKGTVFWMVGLSGSGKSTLARAVQNTLHQQGFLTELLDGDNLRTGVNNNLGFSETDRRENIRRAAEVAKLFSKCGVVTICSLISPTEAIRTMASEIIGENYREVFIECPLEICEQRDVKGLYAKARAGEIQEFTGVSAPFEPPQKPDVRVRTDQMTIEEAHGYLLEQILPIVRLEKSL